MPSLPEYRSRFPDLAGPLGDLYEVHGAIGTDPTGRATTQAGAGSTSAYPAWPDPGWPVLDGYEVVDVLGSGGMGIVYRARDLRHGVTVAVKTMRQVEAAAVCRFKQEFRALLDVSHPNLVTLYELISNGRQWFIVMEYVDGVGFLDDVRGAARPAGGDVSPSAWGLEPSTVDFPRRRPSHHRRPRASDGPPHRPSLPWRQSGRPGVSGSAGRCGGSPAGLRRSTRRAGCTATSSRRT